MRRLRRNSSASSLPNCKHDLIQGTGYAPPIIAPPPVIATRVIAPPVFTGVVDADPITPGIQSTPGVVTPVGPPRIAGGPGFGIGGPGFGIGGPGFVGGPGFGPVGGTSFVGGPPRYGYGGAFSRVGGGLDLDPISPGIQTRPGVITATGPTALRPF